MNYSNLARLKESEKTNVFTVFTEAESLRTFLARIYGHRKIDMHRLAELDDRGIVESLASIARVDDIELLECMRRLPAIVEILAKRYCCAQDVVSEAAISHPGLRWFLRDIVEAFMPLVDIAAINPAAIKFDQPNVANENINGQSVNVTAGELSTFVDRKQLEGTHSSRYLRMLERAAPSNPRAKTILNKIKGEKNE